MTSKTIETQAGRRLAYAKTTGQAGNGPGVVFLGGFKSDMAGTKAIFLEDWARKTGRYFLRFDYSGHGESSGTFEEGAIGDWADDAKAAITHLTDGPQILVGSSMGGWIALRVARGMADKVAGLVGIAAAPDFTEDSMWASFSEAQRKTLMDAGRLELPSDYSEEPYVITRRLIEDGRDQLVLRDPLPLPFPVRLLHGTADTDVAMSVPLRILEHAECPDLRLTFVKDADHRFSEPENLAHITAAIDEVTERLRTA
jgi:pimeloyl-ACP methyl ester carboxylesterase